MAQRSAIYLIMPTKFTRNDIYQLDTFDRKGTLIERLSYVWAVYTNTKGGFYQNLNPYNAADINRAKRYLCQKLNLDADENKENIEEALVEKIIHLQSGGLVTSVVLSASDIEVMPYVSCIEQKSTNKVNSNISLFLIEINQKITQLNELIKTYNNLTNTSDKINQLSEIDKFRIKIELSANYLSAYTENYQNEILEKLFRQIQTQRIRLSNQTSLSHDRSLSPTEREKLIAFLTQMSPLKLKKLAGILCNSSISVSDLNNLYLSSNLNGADFASFLTNNQLSLISCGNSINIKVKSRISSEVFVLKVEETLGNTKRVDERLRKTDFKRHLTAIDGCRQVIFKRKDREEVLHKTILVTDYCTDGSLDNYIQTKY